MNGKKGLFIVIYGPSGVGKSKQMGLLEEQMKQLGITYKRLEYPIYEVGEAGKKLKRLIWKQDPQPSEEQMQELFAKNREDFEPTLKSWLESGVNVLAENYKGTGMVWGVTRGVPPEKMEEINRASLEPDVSIVIDGPRRQDLRPGEGHIYNTDEEEWYRARKVYVQMADKYGWVRVGGDAPIITVAGRIWTVVKLALARGR